jgi:hypothetical protein
MGGPFFMMRNRHGSEPPAITNDVEGQYLGYFENRHGEQWVFVYDRVAQTGALRGGDVGWETVIPVREGQASRCPFATVYLPLDGGGVRA